jgi:hypothetical protein
MGNCAAPSLAIIYMDHVERHILQDRPEILIRKRYIDDMFLITEALPEDLLMAVSSINHHIQFTLE